MVISLRALVAGEQPHSATPESEYDDFGPRTHADLPPARIDDDGAVGIIEGDLVVGTAGTSAREGVVRGGQWRDGYLYSISCKEWEQA